MPSPVHSVRPRLDSGMSVGPYLLERRLGEGGSSVLWLAYDTQARRTVVLKMLLDEGDAGATRARVAREARALAAVDHPGIVRVYGTGEHQGVAYIVVEHVDGQDLKRVLSEVGNLPAARALRIVREVAAALAAAHDAGVTHRDIKPSNILLLSEDRVKVVDFGLARRRYEAGDVQSSRFEFGGTASYLPPEQLEHGLMDERSDVWGLGCVLYELVAGIPPFGRSNSPATMAAILRDEPIYPAMMGGQVEAIVAACLRKNSLQRVASARELASIIRDALEDGVAVPSRNSEPPRGSRGSLRVSAAPASSSLRVPRPPPTPVPPKSSARVSSAPRMLASRAGRIKGAAVRASVAWFRATYGDEALSRVIDRASMPLQSILRRGEGALGIIASGWYDADLVAELVERLQAEASPADLEHYLDSYTAAIAKDNVAGIYRSLFRLIATPDRLVANAQRVWRTYCEDGVLDAVLVAPAQLKVTVSDWESHQPALCDLVGPLSQNMLREIGFLGAVVERTDCVVHGAPACLFDAMWLSTAR